MNPKIIKIIRRHIHKKFKDQLNVLFEKMLKEEMDKQFFL